MKCCGSTSRVWEAKKVWGVAPSTNPVSVESVETEKSNESNG